MLLSLAAQALQMAMLRAVAQRLLNYRTASQISDSGTRNGPVCD
jgi:hypothetical protein